MPPPEPSQSSAIPMSWPSIDTIASSGETLNSANFRQWNVCDTGTGGSYAGGGAGAPTSAREDSGATMASAATEEVASVEPRLEVLRGLCCAGAGAAGSLRRGGRSHDGPSGGLRHRRRGCHRRRRRRSADRHSGRRSGGGRRRKDWPPSSAARPAGAWPRPGRRAGGPPGRRRRPTARDSVSWPSAPGRFRLADPAARPGAGAESPSHPSSRTAAARSARARARAAKVRASGTRSAGCLASVQRTKLPNSSPRARKVA